MAHNSTDGLESFIKFEQYNSTAFLLNIFSESLFLKGLKRPNNDKRSKI